jgi:hypothetical protein
MFTSLVQEMNNSITINKSHTFTEKVEVPSWL